MRTLDPGTWAHISTGQPLSQRPVSVWVPRSTTLQPYFDEPFDLKIEGAPGRLLDLRPLRMSGYGTTPFVTANENALTILKFHHGTYSRNPICTCQTIGHLLFVSGG